MVGSWWKWFPYNQLIYSILDAVGARSRVIRVILEYYFVD